MLTGQADVLLARSEKGQLCQHEQQPPHRLGVPVTSGHPVERPLALPDLVKGSAGGGCPILEKSGKEG